MKWAVKLHTLFFAVLFIHVNMYKESMYNNIINMLSIYMIAHTMEPATKTTTSAIIIFIIKHTHFDA